jgi:FO synthase
VLADAGRVGVPFTTGLLIGIGETLAERAEALFEIRHLAREFGHIQEVIIQNFRAKPDTAMRGMPTRSCGTSPATVAVARLVLGPKMRIQAPPNLIDAEFDLLLRAGIDDWGGVSPVTPDHVNPERPWPQIDELARRSAAAGFTLRERLTIYPEYVRQGVPWLDPRLSPHVSALADPATGLAVESAVPVGLPWQEPDGGAAGGGRSDLHVTIDTTGRSSDRRGDFDTVYGDWSEVAAHVTAGGAVPARLDAGHRGRAAARIERPAALLEPGTSPWRWPCSPADGAALDSLVGIADDLRRAAVGDDVTYVVNRNINFSNVCYVGCRFCAFAQRERDADAYRLSLDQVADRAEEAHAAGATEVCMQGGIDPALPATAYADLVRAVKKRVPDCTCTRSRRWRSSRVRRRRRVHQGVADRPARRGPGHHPGHRRRDPRRRRALGAHQGQAAGRHLGRGDRDGALAGPAVELDHDVRPRRPSTALAGPLPGARRRCRTVRAGSPSSWRCRSSTTTRRSTWPASPGPARPGGRTARCTRWPGSCCTGGSRTSSAPG